MKNANQLAFARGMRDGIPIALGYLAVAFTLGIAAKNAGFTALQAMLASLTNNASAGEFAGFTLIAAGSGYLEVAVMELVANARYLLMSCALSQKLPPDTSLLHRFLISYDVTDEIFGISMAYPGRLNPFYSYGAFAVAIPGWAGGTFLGVLMGSLLPASIVRALSVGLYGLFLAIIVPPAKKKPDPRRRDPDFHGSQLRFHPAARYIRPALRHPDDPAHRPDRRRRSHTISPRGGTR